MTARVLVVDDTVANVKLLEAKLAVEYFDVVTAYNGSDAISSATENPPDIVLLDIMMPGMDGFEVCRRLKSDQRTAHVPIIMVTALSDAEDRVRGLDSGADDFLTKPVNDLALYARIRSLVRLKMTADEWRLRQATGAHLGMFVDDSAAKPKAGGGGNLLVVEDNAAYAERLRRALAADNDVLEVVSQPIEALARANEGVYDVLVVSLALRETDGLRLCAQIRSQAQTRNIPLIALVEDGDFARIAKALDLGVNDYILRSADTQEILARVRTQIRRRRYQDGLRANFERNVALALNDSLTGLYNRRYLTAHLAALMDRTLRTGKALSLLMIDVDHFKVVNDTYGHAIGDEVLIAVGERLSRHLRSFDTVARWGGEEFVVVMPEAEARVAHAVAERLRARIADEPIPVKHEVGQLSVTISIGIAISGDGLANPDDLLRAADGAMYEAKRQGRNRVTEADPSVLAAKRA
jgi:two-component system cell cycle response regulator